MAVVSVTEMAGRKGKVDEKGYRTYERNFLVLVDSLNDGAIVASSVGIPARYASYIVGNEFDLRATVRDIIPTQRTDNYYLWDVKVTYDSKPFEARDKQGQPSDSNNHSSDPTARPWKWSVKTKNVDKPITVDTHSQKLVNSAGCPFDNQLVVPNAHFIITVEQFVYQIDFFKDSNWLNNVNTNGYLGFLSYSLLVTGLDYQSNYDNNMFTWTRTVTMEYNPDLWHPWKYLDCGTTCKKTKADGSQGLVNCTDAHGQPVHSAVPLDGSGHQLAVGNPTVYLSFYPYIESDFTKLL